MIASFLHFPMGDNHFGSKNNSFKKPWDEGGVVDFFQAL
jgi:hypothetical protein